MCKDMLNEVSLDLHIRKNPDCPYVTITFPGIILMSKIVELLYEFPNFQKTSVKLNVVLIYSSIHSYSFFLKQESLKWL